MALPRGPYPAPELDFWVRSGSPGVFILSKDATRWDVLGTSENDVKAAIHDFVLKTRKEWFQFYYALTAARRYSVECEWYHAYRPSNYSEHPQPPTGAAVARCSICGVDLR